jgi:hypothetical protein
MMLMMTIMVCGIFIIVTVVGKVQVRILGRDIV